MMHALRLSTTALVVIMGLCGAALAQKTAAADAGTQPEQTQQTPATPASNAGMSKERMHQGAGTPTPNAPDTNFNCERPHTGHNRSKPSGGKPSP